MLVNLEVKREIRTHRCDGFVVAVDSVKVRSQIIRNKNCCTDDYVFHIVTEQTAFPVQLFFASIHIHDMLEL